MKRWARFATLPFLLTAAFLRSAASDPVVQAVLFYSPACGHCHYVITEVLPPLLAAYGPQLQMAGVNTSEPAGHALFQEAVEVFGIPDNRRGVPTLIVGEVVLVGSIEIETQLPGLIEAHLARGGLAWPNLPGLLDALDEAAPASTAAAAETPGPTPAQAGDGGGNFALTGGVLARIARDPVGNGLAIVLLGAMLVVVGQVSIAWLRPPAVGLPRQRWRSWLLPGLAMLGLAIAGYLTYVETTGAEAVCGPVGDCNTVQHSPYARLFGVVPIGALGMVGYAAMLLAWLGARLAPSPWADRALAALAALAFVGTLFSIYLTFLEPIVIGATCVWCLASSLLITCLLWVTAAPGSEALGRAWG